MNYKIVHEMADDMRAKREGVWTESGCHQLAKGFQVRERSNKKGIVYDFHYRDKSKVDGRAHRVMEAKGREEAIAEGHRLIAEVLENRKPRSKTETPQNGEEAFRWTEFHDTFFKELEAKEGIRASTIGLYRNDMKRLDSFFRHYNFKDIQFKDIEAYRDMRREKTKADGERAVSDGTIGREVQLGHLYFRKAGRKGFVENVENPFMVGELELYTPEREVWMTEGMQKFLWPIIEKCPKPLLDLSNFLLNIGMRPHNIVDLTWSHVLWEEKQIFVKISDFKGKKNAYYPMNPIVLEILERLQKENGKSEYVFIRHDEEGEPHKMTTRWIERWWRDAVEKAEKESSLDFQELRFYELKHTYGTRLAGMGYSAFRIAKMMNITEAVAQRYIKNDPVANQKAADDYAEKYPEKSVWNNDGLFPEKNSLSSENSPGCLKVL